VFIFLMVVLGVTAVAGALYRRLESWHWHRSAGGPA
jgi:hypothetical protein